MKPTARIISIIAMLALLLSVISGCAKEASEPTAASSPASAISEAPAAQSNATASSEPKEDEAAASISYPISDGSTTFSVFVTNRSLDTTYDTLSDMPIEQYIAKQTGVTLTYTEVASDAAQEKFNLMIASGNWNDFLADCMSYYASSLDYAVSENMFYNLSDKLASDAPDYWSYLENNAEALRDSTTDEGNIVGVYTFMNQAPSPNQGLTLRGDLLEQTGLETPVTYDDFTNVLSAIQTLGVAHPLWTDVFSTEQAFFSSGYDVPHTGFFVKDGQVKYSVLESGYGDYIKMLNNWYNKGFFPDDWLSMTNPMLDEGVANGEAALCEQAAGRLPQVVSSISTANATLVPVNEPVQQDGQQLHLQALISNTPMGNKGTMITTACNDLDTALKYINYFYTDAGIMAYNYGLEDVSYNLDADGKPQFTDLITNNPDGLSFNQAVKQNMYNGYLGRVLLESVDHYTFNDVQKNCLSVWSVNNDTAYKLPNSVSLTTDESEQFNAKYSDISTYVDENLRKFLVGDRPLSDWDTFVSEVKDMGSDECIGLYQQAYERYLAR